MTNEYNPLIEGMNTESFSRIFDILNVVTKLEKDVTEDERIRMREDLKYLRVNKRNKIDSKEKEKLELPKVFKVGKMTYAQLEFFAGIKGLDIDKIFMPATNTLHIQGKYVANFWKYDVSKLANLKLETMPVVYLDEVHQNNQVYKLADEEVPPASWTGETTDDDPLNLWKPFLVATAAPMRASLKEERVLAVVDENKEINWHKTLVEFLRATFNWKYTMEQKTHALQDLVQNFAPHLRDGLEDLEFEEIVNQLNGLTQVLTPAQMRYKKLVNYKRLAGQPIAQAMAKIQKLYSSCYHGSKEVSPDPSSDNYDLSLAEFMQKALLKLVPDAVKGYVQTCYDKARATNTQIYIEHIIQSVARHECAENLLPLEDMHLCDEDNKKKSTKSFTVSLNNILPEPEDESEDDSDDEFKARMNKSNKVLVQNIRHRQMQRKQQRLAANNSSRPASSSSHHSDNAGQLNPTVNSSIGSSYMPSPGQIAQSQAAAVQFVRQAQQSAAMQGTGSGYMPSAAKPVQQTIPVQPVQHAQVPAAMQIKNENTAAKGSIMNLLPSPGAVTPPGHSTPKMEFPEIHLADPDATPIEGAVDNQYIEDDFGSQHLNLNYDFKPLEPITATPSTPSTARSKKSSSLPSVHEIETRGAIKAIQDQLQAAPSDADKTVLASSDTSRSTSYEALQGSSVSNSFVQLSPEMMELMKTRSFETAREQAERFRQLIPPKDPPPQPEIDIRRIASSKEYLAKQAYNLEKNKNDSLPYKAYWEYFNTMLFKKATIPSHHNFIGTYKDTDMFLNTIDLVMSLIPTTATIRRVYFHTQFCRDLFGPDIAKKYDEFLKAEKYNSVRIDRSPSGERTDDNSDSKYNSRRRSDSRSDSRTDRRSKNDRSSHQNDRYRSERGRSDSRSKPDRDSRSNSRSDSRSNSRYRSYNRSSSAHHRSKSYDRSSRNDSRRNDRGNRSRYDKHQKSYDKPSNYRKGQNDRARKDHRSNYKNDRNYRSSGKQSDKKNSSYHKSRSASRTSNYRSQSRNRSTGRYNNRNRSRDYSRNRNRNESRDKSRDKSKDKSRDNSRDKSWSGERSSRSHSSLEVKFPQYKDQVCQKILCNTRCKPDQPRSERVCMKCDGKHFTHNCGYYIIYNEKNCSHCKNLKHTDEECQIKNLFPQPLAEDDYRPN